MILYLDTSALVKLYAMEEDREVVEQAVDEARLVATSVVAYAEARAALARKRREGVFSVDKHQEAVDALDDDWETFEKLEANGELVRAAGDLAEQHALRGFDAIHLASAVVLVRDASSGGGDEGVADETLFLSFDSDLMTVAGKVMRLYKSGESLDAEDRS